MKARIDLRLKLTPAQYNDMVMEMWIQWCGLKTENDKSLQKVLVCQPLFRWWLRELRKLEKEYLKISHDYRNVMCITTRLELYEQTISPLYKRFSKPLIQKAYEHKPITEQN